MTKAMTSMPFQKPIYRIVSAIAVAAVAVIGQPAAASLAYAAPLDMAQRVTDRPQTQEETGEFISPGDCAPANWSPPDARLYTVPPGGPSSISVGVAAPNALNAGTLQYQVYNPGGGYTGWIGITDSVRIDSRTIVMTATDVQPVQPVNLAFQSIQFRVSPVVGSTLVCSPVHRIFAVDSRVRMPLLIQNYASTVIAPVGYIGDPTKPFYNDNICRAVNIWPGANYLSRFAEKENLFQITTLATSTLTVTVSGFTSPGQIQLRRANGVCGTGDFYRDPATDSSVFQATPGSTRVLAVNDVVPGKSYLRVVSSDSIAPNTSFQMNIAFGPAQANVGPYEPNNTACAAYPIAQNTNYSAYPDDASDWYSFTLASPLNLQITMTNFVVSGAGQYILYKSENCAALGTALTVQDKASPSYGPVSVGAGKYFMRVAVGSGFQSTQLYTFRVNTSAATTGWNPKFELCAQLTGCGKDFANSKFTVYWNNAPNMNLMRMQLGGRAASGTCPATSTISNIFAPASVFATNGSWELVNVNAGSYDMSIYTTSSDGNAHATPTFQININCTPGATTGWEPTFNICPALSNCGRDFSNNRFTVYWVAAPNQKLMRMLLGGRAAAGSCPATSDIPNVFAPTSVFATNGSWELVNVNAGSYDVSIYTESNTGQSHATPVFRVNINCTAPVTGLALDAKGITTDTVASDATTSGAAAGESITPYDVVTGEPMPTVIPDPTAMP